jgi:hypothetical protein
MVVVLEMALVTGNAGDGTGSGNPGTGTGGDGSGNSPGGYGKLSRNPQYQLSQMGEI